MKIAIALLALTLPLLSAPPQEITGLTEPFSVVFDQDDTLYGVEYENGNRVFRLQDGKLDFIAGRKSPGGNELGDVAEGDGGPAAEGRFNGMHDLALHPDHRLFIADTFNSRIRVIDLNTGKLSTLGDGKLKFKNPYTVSLHPDHNKLLVADLGQLKVFEIDLASHRMKTVTGNGKRGIPEDGKKATLSPLVGPRAAIYGADGTIFIASREGHALRHVDQEGRIHTLVNPSGKKGYSGDNGPGTAAQLNGPKHLALDPGGNIVISDDNNHALRLYKVKEKTIHLLAGTPPKSGKSLGKEAASTSINRPHGARYDADGTLWVVDSFNHRLLHFCK
ncbi:MAG: hypothetical protein QNL33_20465 [Akkermansiaceae bacterium]|jgi:WD40 repeat protein